MTIATANSNVGIALSAVVDRPSLLAFLAEYHVHYIDARTLKCPEPLMLLQSGIAGLEKSVSKSTIQQDSPRIKDSNLILVEARDPGTMRDIPDFCKFLEYELLKPRQLIDPSGGQVEQTSWLFLVSL